jgi:hypothetical protein
MSLSALASIASLVSSVAVLVSRTRCTPTSNALLSRERSPLCILNALASGLMTFGIVITSGAYHSVALANAMPYCEVDRPIANGTKCICPPGYEGILLGTTEGDQGWFECRPRAHVRSHSRHRTKHTPVITEDNPAYEENYQSPATPGPATHGASEDQNGPPPSLPNEGDHENQKPPNPLTNPGSAAPP